LIIQNSNFSSITCSAFNPALYKPSSTPSSFTLTNNNFSGSAINSDEGGLAKKPPKNPGTTKSAKKKKKNRRQTIFLQSFILHFSMFLVSKKKESLVQDATNSLRLQFWWPYNSSFHGVFVEFFVADCLACECCDGCDFFRFSLLRMKDKDMAVIFSALRCCKKAIE
jgi:hypothetical protein